MIKMFFAMCSPKDHQFPHSWSQDFYGESEEQIKEANPGLNLVFAKPRLDGQDQPRAQVEDDDFIYYIFLPLDTPTDYRQAIYDGNCTVIAISKKEGETGFTKLEGARKEEALSWHVPHFSSDAYQQYLKDCES